MNVYLNVVDCNPIVVVLVCEVIDAIAKTLILFVETVDCGL